MARDGNLSQRTLRSPLGRVRGLGAAKEGVHHWWAQRVTAVALVPLTLWFVASLLVLAGASHGEVALWAARPHNAVLLLALIGATFWHGALGLQVVIEDYIHAEGARLAAMLAMKAAMLLAGLSAALAVLKVAL
jgi:succinate dehydrogenase / fumarate reductase membrane anchor subunit